MAETTIMTEETISPTEELTAPRHVVFEEALEAILFAGGHPIAYSTLARVFDMTPAEVKKRVFAYASEYNTQPIERGVILLAYPESCQLCTKEYYLPEIREALGIKKSGSLSSSALEVLAIIAYNQPVTRIFIDTLRRVDSAYAVNSLIDRGLIECKGRMDVPGRPMLFGTTEDFLRCFGLHSLDDLPSTTEDILTMLEKAKREDDGRYEKEVDPDQITMDEALNERESAKTDTEFDGAPSADDNLEAGEEHSNAYIPED